MAKDKSLADVEARLATLERKFATLQAHYRNMTKE